ncbi:MAG: hypothetical protein PW999_00655 [Paraburkholderia tropica]|nr:hypothetical protein [Paraburkholderia tropica]
MTPSDKPNFLAVLSRTFRVQRQPVPEAELLDVWWTKLEPFPIEAVAAAFSRHLDVSEFAPTPAAILKHLPKESDGRPEVDEAWAIALGARDERDTVVWTQEIAEAWSAALPVLNGDEIGARMAFKASYARITERNRSAGLPAQWTVSQGFDLAQREEVVAQAVRQGRLSIAHAKAAVPLLAGPSEESPVTPQAEQQLAKLRAMCAGIGAARARASAERAERAREAFDDLARAKQQTAARVAAYEASRA